MDNSLSIRNLHFENIPLDQEFEDRIGQGERRLVGNKDYRRVGKEDTDIEVNRGTDTKICVCSITRVLSILSLAGLIDRLLEDVERRDLYSRCKLATEIACRSCIIYRTLFAAITVLANVQRLYTM